MQQSVHVKKEGRRKARFNMATFLHVILIIAIVLVCLFVLSFIVYFFNLDMKLTAAIEPLMQKHIDKIERDTHL